MKLKWAALLIIGASLLSQSSGSETQANPDAQLQRSAPQQIISRRILDTYLKPPPQQQNRIIPQQFAPTAAPLPFMQRIARWFLSSESPGETRPFYPRAPQKPPQIAHQNGHSPAAIKEACRPCNKIPWMPMFPIKEAISNAVLSLVTGQSSGSGGDAIRPKEPPFGPYISGPSGGGHVPASAPQKYPTHTQAHFVSSLAPRPVNGVKPLLPPPPPPPPLYREPPPPPPPPPYREPPPPPPPSPYRAPPPPPPPPPYRAPPPPFNPGNQRPIVQYLSPPFNRPSIYGQMRPFGQFGYIPPKEEITVTIHENKNRPNGIYSIPGGPQIHLMSDFRPSGFGETGKDQPGPPKVQAEIIPSVPIANYLSSIEYPMVYGHSHMMDLTNVSPKKPVDIQVQGRLPPISGPAVELPIHYGHPDKNAGIIGPLPQHSNFSHPPPPTYENAHQGGPTGEERPYPSPDPQYSSPAPPYSSPAPPYSSPGPPYSTPTSTYSTVTPKIFTSSHSSADIPTVSSTIGSISADGGSTVDPFSRVVDSTTRASIISSTYSIPIRSSVEGPKFSNSYSPPASTYVDIQPSLQTAEYLSSLPNNAFRVHPGQGFRLSENFHFHANIDHPSHTLHKQTNGDLKGHYITKQPPSPTPAPSGSYQGRPSPAPFQTPKGEHVHHPVSLAPNPSLWTRDHPYSYEIPPSDVPNGQNHDALSTGSGQTQIPTKNHHFIEEPPIYSFIHNANGGHFHGGGQQGSPDNWRYTGGSGNLEVGPSTSRPPSSSPYYGQPPTPFTTSTTAAPPVVITNPGYSASTVAPNYSGNFGDENRNKNKKTKQVQIIIPYITGGLKDSSGKSIEESYPLNDGFPNWHQRLPSDEDYHDHQESRTVTASAIHPNHLNTNKTGEMKFEGNKDNKFQHVLATNLKTLLKSEVDETVSENPLLRLQKNIDAWTAQQFSSKPNFVTSNEGLTTKSVVNLFEDHEASGSHDHSATARPDSASTIRPRSTSESTASTFWGIQSNLVIPESKSNESGEVQRGTKASEGTTTAANWSKTQVAISPTTKEKVYVVTPMTGGSWDETTTASAPKHHTTPHSTPRGVTVTSSGNTFTSPRFLIRPTPGGKSETWPSNGIFVTTTTDASVRENAADVSSNDIFQRSERARHKASEGTFAVFGASDSPGAAVPTPSYTLLPGTEVRTFTGHSRVVTSVSAPTYSYTTSHGKAHPTQAPPPIEDASKVSGRRIDDFDSTPEEIKRISGDHDPQLTAAEGEVVELEGDPS